MINGELLKKITDTDYADSLMSVIRDNGNIEQFIQSLEARQREDFLKTNESIVTSKKNIAEYKEKLEESKGKISKLNKEKEIALELKRRVEELKASYPKSKQRELEAYLGSVFTKNEEPNAKKLTEQPKNIIIKIRDGKSIKDGNKKLGDLVVFCKSNNVEALSQESDVIRSAIKGQDISGSIKNIDISIANETKYIQSDNEIIKSYESLIERKTLEYDSSDTKTSSYAYRRQTQREDIVQFYKESKEALSHPATISREEIAKTGLSEEFISKHIMESKFPEKNLRSIRRSYENLDRPAAPMVAFTRRGLKADGSAFTTDIADDVVATLKKRGLDAVLETDIRAKDTNVFVVDKKKHAIYAPFLAPDDALKANIAMIDAVYECNGVVGRSSPRTRETFTIATHESIGKPADETRCGEINLETIACHHSKERYDEVMRNFANEFTEKCDYRNLCSLMNKLQNDNLDRCVQLQLEVNAKAKPYLDSGSWTTENANNLAKDFVKEHREDFMPYIKKEYQNAMINEAFEKGIDPNIPNTENLQMLEQGKPVTSVFHGGKNGGMPYSVLARDKRMCHVYGATTLEGVQLSELPQLGKICNGVETGGALGYAFTKSSHDKKEYNTEKKFGFVYEYESRGEKQELVYLENPYMEVSCFNGGKFNPEHLSLSGDETAILPHQNKLKKVYIAVSSEKNETKVFPLELDKDGNIADKKWRDFVELHNPVDDTLEGFTVDRQNNMIAEYDTLGKEKMMDRKLEILKEPEKPLKENLAEKEPVVIQTPEIARAEAPKQQPVTQPAAVAKEEPQSFEQMNKQEKSKFVHRLRLGFNSFLARINPEKERTLSNQNAQQLENPALTAQIASKKMER